MFTIIEKKILNPQMILFRLDAPYIARKVLPGQFVILRTDEKGERIPLTVADYDREGGWITIIFQTVGATTQKLAAFTEGQALPDVVGPLGKASHFDGCSRVAVIGGGAGCAIAYPQAKALFNAGVTVDMIAGFRNKELIILEDEMAAVSTNLFVMTDDGSNGQKGFVTQKLAERTDASAAYDLVVAIGPLPMMRAVCQMTKEFGIKTIVSMNPIMIDGTGMCGGCRLTVGGETKFACVDGPDFDGHQVDFEEAMMRSSIYREQEQHSCNLLAKEFER